MEERQSRLSSMVWRRLRPYFCVRLILLNSMFSNFCHVLNKLIQNHETLSPTVNVKGYLLKTLRHKLYDTIEKNRKMEDISLYEDTFQTDELFSRISLDTTEADERVKLLMKALTKLSPHQREIIYLYYVNGLGHDEIAEILGINYQSSKNLLSRTLSKLRRWFSLDALIMGGIHYVLFPMLT